MSYVASPTVSGCLAEKLSVIVVLLDPVLHKPCHA